MKEKEMLDQLLIELGKKTYQLLLSKGASHFEAEDIVQETYYKLLSLFLELKPEQLQPWFFRVALNLFIDEKRKINRLIIVDQEFYNDYPQSHDDYQKISDVNQIEIALDQIKSSYKELLLLKYYYGLSYNEIGAILEIKPNSVKQKLLRARQSIQKERRMTHE